MSIDWPWLCAGLIVGACIPRRYIHQWRVAMPPLKRVHTWLQEHVVSVAAVAIVLATLATCAVIFSASQQRIHDLARDAHNTAVAQCQAKVNTALLVTLRARSDTGRAAVLAPAQFSEVLQRILTHPNANKATRTRQLAQLLAATQAQNKAYYEYVTAQKKHPLPELPDCSKAVAP